jgi:sterol desaturase/sphingolipid hydroxylase (fatty acid hydroxylase superfamily)
MLESWFLEHGESAQFIVFFTLLGVLAIAERFVPRRRVSMRRGQRWPTNVAMTALNIVMFGILPTTFIGAAAWAAEQRLGLLNMVDAKAWLLVPVSLLVRSFISFSTHWLMHRVPWCWRVHRVHHLDIELDVSTTVRFHPAEFFTQLALGLPLVVLFGLSPWVLMAYEVADAAATLFSHANVRLPARIERVLRYVIVTPDLHRVHHSTHQPETDSNFGAVFPIWDLIFRTFRTKSPSELEDMPIGLAEVRDRRADNLWWLLKSPFCQLDPRSIRASATAATKASGSRRPNSPVAASDQPVARSRTTCDQHEAPSHDWG